MVGEEVGEERDSVATHGPTVKTLDFIPSVRKTMRGFLSKRGEELVDAFKNEDLSCFVNPL